MALISPVSRPEETGNSGNGPGYIWAGSPEIIEIIGFILLTFKPCHIQSYVWHE